MQKLGMVILMFILLFLSLYLRWNDNCFFKYYPIFQIFPDNKTEVEEMRNIVGNRDDETTKLFMEHDIHGAKHLFTIEMPETKDLWMSQSLRNFMISFIVVLKLFFNRKRPFQTDPNMGHIDTPTSYNPSFPSGHAMEAYMISTSIGKRRPELKDKAMEIADRCAQLRVEGGVHFPSDIKAAKWIVDNIFYYFI